MPKNAQTTAQFHSFHTKLGTMEDRNGMDLTEAEDIRRGGKNTQKNSTKKIFMTQITTMM